MSVGANEYYCPLCNRNISNGGKCPNCKDKIVVESFDVNLINGKVDNKRASYIWKDEELDCEHIHKFDDVGTINVCIGNEPYSCHRAKKEGLCHKGEVHGNSSM